MIKRIAMISDNASPLAVGEAQGAYVARAARSLTAEGWEVDVFTRRVEPQQAEIVEWFDGARVVHVPAGVACFAPREDWLKVMPQFTSYMIRFFAQKRYDLVHANFFLSGLVALNLKRATATPFVVTFHDLGRAAHKIHATSPTDEFPEVRLEIEDRIVREADFILAADASEEKDLLYRYDAPLEKVRVVADASNGERLDEIYQAVINRRAAQSAAGYCLLPTATTRNLTRRTAA